MVCKQTVALLPRDVWHNRYMSLKELREARGWTQAELARRTGIAKRVIGQWETGHHAPSPLYRRVLADVLQVAQADLRFDAVAA